MHFAVSLRYIIKEVINHSSFACDALLNLEYQKKRAIERNAKNESKHKLLLETCSVLQARQQEYLGFSNVNCDNQINLALLYTTLFLQAKYDYINFLKK